MTPHRSWAASIVTFAVAVLAACFLLNLAAGYLREALPVLGPVVLVVAIVVMAWRWWRRRLRGW